MAKEKKKWGDRKDGIWLKDIPAMNRIMPALMPNRADNEAFITVDIDLRPINAYLEKVNAGRTEDKYTFFHLVSAAAGKAFVLRPKMNRFVCNNKLYQRKNVTVAFTVKKRFDDHAEEALAFFEYDPKETLESYHEKIMKVIHQTKSFDEKDKDTSTGAMDIVTKLPQWMITAIVKSVLWLDKHGWAPDFLIGSDPNHAAIFLSNLGSIGLEAGYHHLVNWGTNSCFIVTGKKYMKMEYDKDGNPDLHEVLPLGITLDERIADGYYYSGTVALVKELLAHPELLEMPADTPVEYAIRR
ncbi:MAG: 2-oxo acid dehydrogenase subunit E2 [Oscillospiraceae bacterium]|nr:2-oxo acid dehydrogenase subunit E2 [Oscillospiraceae bacterium]